MMLSPKMAQPAPGAGPLPTNGNAQRGSLPPIPVPTPAQLIALVDEQERYLGPLRRRMEADWQLKILAEFDAGEGYQSYTSNEPSTYFDKITASLAGASLKIRIPVERARREQRERESAAERFYVGILKANDERLLRLGQPRLLATLAAFINLRGWYCGRNLLLKDLETGRTTVDITAWDPMHVTWGMGAKGLKWVCNKTKKTAGEIADEYGLMAVPGQMGLTPTAADYFSSQSRDNSQGIDVYDWYDEMYNIVVVGDQYAKPPTVHSLVRRVPAFFGPVGALPLIQSQSTMGQENLAHHGESIFAANRRIYEKVNLVLSTMLQLVALSRNQAFWIGGGDGTTQLTKNPFLEGSQFSLPEGYTFNVVQLLEMSKDTGAFLGLISSEIQRGALPYSVYGQLAFQLSGYAVNLLKQATDAPILPRKEAVQNAIWQIMMGIGDQFATGVYEPMRLRGWGENRSWFDEEFMPDMMVGLPSCEVELVVETPDDAMQNILMAQKAREGPTPLLPDRIILDTILKMQDTDSIDDAIKEQMAERILPEGVLWTLMKAAEIQGRPELAALLYGALMKMSIMGVPPPGGMAGANGQGGVGGGGGVPGGGGAPPEALPAPMQGAPVPQPTPQQGSNVAAGSPRPGARSVPPVVQAWGQ